MSRERGLQVQRQGAPLEMPGYLSSPRSNLNRLLANSCRQPLDDDAIERSAEILGAADAENKLHHRKLYLVLDLDETLVFSQRLEPGAAPVGTQITVRGQPFDVVLRPGLKFFLNSAQKNFIIFLYTMGDAEYTRAVLDVIDPDHSIFTGAPHPTQSQPIPAPLPFSLLPQWPLSMARPSSCTSLSAALLPSFLCEGEPPVRVEPCVPCLMLSSFFTDEIEYERK